MEKAQDSCVLMVVQSRNFNIADERPIEYGLWDRDIPCHRCEWGDVFRRTRLADDRTLCYHPYLGDSELQVSVVYYRAGYKAAEYAQQDCQIRLHLEQSRAIKCPDILAHLTTLKVVQEALSRPNNSERFLPFESSALVRQTDRDMKVLDRSRDGLEAREVDLNPDTARYHVLKPNLEGGGHNVYGEDIAGFLSEKVPETEWGKYILMRKIEPPATVGILMMPQEIYTGPIVSELGILGACLWRRRGNQVEILSNQVAGWMFKTKPLAVNEMSVVKGYGCFDAMDLME